MSFDNLEDSKSDEGWVEWSGGERPVDAGVEVEVMLRTCEKFTGMAYSFNWDESSLSFGIAKYRLGHAPRPDYPEPTHHVRPGLPEEARVMLGLTPAPGAELFPKQQRYKDDNGEDWIDEFARTKSVEEFRGAMSFTIGKYNRRCGKKDKVLKEVTKMADYAERWRQYETKLEEK